MERSKENDASNVRSSGTRYYGFVGVLAYFKVLKWCFSMKKEQMRKITLNLSEKDNLALLRLAGAMGTTMTGAIRILINEKISGGIEKIELAKTKSDEGYLYKKGSVGYYMNLPLSELMK